MIRSTLSLLGMYNYSPDIFDDFKLPTQLERSKETIINNVLLQTAELEVIYPDSNFLKMAIGVWSSKEVPVWEKLYKTTVLEYNPIWNKDGTITETESGSGTEHADVNSSKTGSTTNTVEKTGTEKTEESTDSTLTTSASGKTGSTVSNSKNTDNFVTGFNSETLAQKDRSTETGTETSSGTSSTEGENNGSYERNVKNTNKTSETGTENRNDNEVNNENRNHETTRNLTRRETGNIGITTTQQMIKEEREVSLYNIIDFIVEDFKNRFCLLVY